MKLSVRQQLLALASDQVGYHETPPGSNRGLRVDVYTGGRAEPWCAHFVAWLFRQVGLDLPDDIPPSPKQHNPIASVSHLERVMTELGWMHQEPKTGDLVFYKTRGRSDAGPGRHIGFVAYVDPRSREIHTIEGNWSDSVQRRVLPLGHNSITGYGRHPRLDG